jgi:hypothetical protein
MKIVEHLCLTTDHHGVHYPSKQVGYPNMKNLTNEDMKELEKDLEEIWNKLQYKYTIEWAIGISALVLTSGKLTGILELSWLLALAIPLTYLAILLFFNVLNIILMVFFMEDYRK